MVQMAQKSVIEEAQQIRVAIDLIKLGARLSLLQDEISLSRERLIKLYKEVTGQSPAKGLLPYSTERFMNWSLNIHASLFMNIYNFMVTHTGIDGLDALISSYRLYLDQIQGIEGGEPELSITRAWFLLRFFKAEMLQLTACKTCGGQFVVHVGGLHEQYVCGVCNPPPRAGKTAANKKRETSVIGMAKTEQLGTVNK